MYDSRLPHLMEIDKRAIETVLSAIDPIFPPATVNGDAGLAQLCSEHDRLKLAYASGRRSVIDQLRAALERA